MFTCIKATTTKQKKNAAASFQVLKFLERMLSSAGGFAASSTLFCLCAMGSTIGKALGFSAYNILSEFLYMIFLKQSKVVIIKLKLFVTTLNISH